MRSSPPEQRISRALGHLQLLEARYTDLRSFAPEVLDALPFGRRQWRRPLLRAVEILRQLNTTGRRRVPDEAPPTSCPPGSAPAFEAARAEGNRGPSPPLLGGAVLYGLQAALRSGDV